MAPESEVRPQNLQRADETINRLPSHKDSWKKGLRCIVPSKVVYEPRYYDDHANERWRIEKENDEPFAIAGIYSQWFEDGVEKFSFSMVTVNCADHPFYSQFHEPGKEKRMPAGLTSRYRPFASLSLTGLSPDFAFLTAVSVSGMGSPECEFLAIPPTEYPMPPKIPPEGIGLQYPSLDVRKQKSPVDRGF